MYMYVPVLVLNCQYGNATKKCEKLKAYPNTDTKN